MLLKSVQVKSCHGICYFISYWINRQKMFRLLRELNPSLCCKFIKTVMFSIWITKTSLTSFACITYRTGEAWGKPHLQAKTNLQLFSFTLSYFFVYYLFAVIKNVPPCKNREVITDYRWVCFKIKNPGFSLFYQSGASLNKLPFANWLKIQLT